MSPTRGSSLRDATSSASPASIPDLAPPPPPSPPKPTPLQDAIFDEADFLATQASFGDLNQDPDDYVFSSEFFDLNAAASPPSPFVQSTGPSLGGYGGAATTPIPNVNGFSSFGEPMDFGIGSFDGPSAGGAGLMDDVKDLGLPSAGMDGLMPTVEGTENLCVPLLFCPSLCQGVRVDSGFHCRSASEILALLHQGEFDYSQLFPDQEIFPV